MEIRQKDSTWSLGLSLSIATHALVLIVAACWYVLHPLTLRWPEMNVSVAAPIIVPLPQQAPAPKDNFDSADEAPFHDDSGEHDSHGTANRSTDGAQPMLAAAGLEQANLARSSAEDHSQLDNALREAQSNAKISGDASGDSPGIFGVGETVPTVSTPIVHDTPKPAATAQPSVKPIDGHHSRSSDTNSMAFANAPSAIFRDGRMEARNGLKVRTTRPDFGLAAMNDAVSLGKTSVVLGVNIDTDGNVSNVVILHSSGSDNIDLPCERAIYNWWFEPQKDADGHPKESKWVVRMLF